MSSALHFLSNVNVMQAQQVMILAKMLKEENKSQVAWGPYFPNYLVSIGPVNATVNKLSTNTTVIVNTVSKAAGQTGTAMNTAAMVNTAMNASATVVAQTPSNATW